jgi:hypothetical protein
MNCGAVIEQTPVVAPPPPPPPSSPFPPVSEDSTDQQWQDTPTSSSDEFGPHSTRNDRSNLVTKPAARFGDANQIVVGADLDLSGDFTAESGGVDDFSTGLSLGLDYFVVRNFSIGGSAAFGYSGSRSKSVHSDTIDTDFVARIGYNIPLGERFSLWPKISFSIGYAHTSSNLALLTESSLGYSPALELPLEIQLASHLLLGVGPFLQLGMSSSALATSQYLSFGLSTSIAGYF